MSYRDLQKKVKELEIELDQLKLEFMDRDSFKKFADNLFNEIGGYSQICITGYFSEAVRDSLEMFARNHRLKLISQEFDVNKPRDRKNLEVLRKLCSFGADAKVNNRLHARFLLAHSPEFPVSTNTGLLVIGSFDFNTEGISKERYDAGIKTNSPDLVSAAKELFMQMWNEPESLNLNEKCPETSRLKLPKSASLEQF